MVETTKAASESTGEGAPLKRQVRVDGIRDGDEGVIEATRAECQAIAAMLDLIALDRLTFTYRLGRHAGGRITLDGTLKAAVTQSCVLSLEPVEAVLDVPVSLEFWPQPLIEELDRQAEDKAHPLREWPEPIVDGRIDLGFVIYETFATALDPYPKRAGASLPGPAGESQSAGEAEPKGPFAALAQLKPR
jgi:uncharacterized metal-binding protein YceD (DUF177 family)